MVKSNKKYNKLKSVVSIIGFLICTALLLYPLVSDRWNKYRNDQIIEKYISEINNGDPSFYNSELEKAYQYNEKLALISKNMVSSRSLQKNEEYESILNATGTGIMCYIEIPKIGVTEPVYHYSSNASLEKGIGHIHGSSLPVGEKNTFCILTGHRGLPSQKLFTDLDRIEIGDMFYIHVLGHTLAYKVYDIQVVLPNEVDSLVLQSDRDIVTLVTCDPYGVNTHRMLVFGERAEFNQNNVSDGRVTTEEHHTVVDPAFVIFIGFICFIIIMTVTEIVRNQAEKRVRTLPQQQTEDENGDYEEKPRKLDRKRKLPIPQPFMFVEDRFTPVPAKKHRRRRMPVRYEYDDYDDYEYEYEIVRIRRRPRRHERKHKPSYYLMLGLCLGFGIAGIAVLIYRFIKKRKDREIDTHEPY